MLLLVPIFLQEFSPRFQAPAARFWPLRTGSQVNGWITSETSHILDGRKFIITKTTYKIFSQSGIASFILIGLNRAAAPIQDKTSGRIGDTQGIGSKNTLPETNMAPENGGPLEKDIPNLKTIISLRANVESFREGLRFNLMLHRISKIQDLLNLNSHKHHFLAMKKTPLTFQYFLLFNRDPYHGLL